MRHTHKWRLHPISEMVHQEQQIARVIQPVRIVAEDLLVPFVARSLVRMFCYPYRSDFEALRRFEQLVP